MTTSTAQVLHARSPEDVLAAVPVLLGFVPEESVVMLTFGAPSQFHARVDLPHTRTARAEATASLVTPCRDLGVRQVVLVLYTASAGVARACVRELCRSFASAGIAVLDVLRVEGDRWFVVQPGRRGGEGPGLPFDRSSHAFTAEAVVSGRVVRSSRAELASTVAADPDQVAAVAAVLGEVPDGRVDVPELVERLVTDGPPPDPVVAARLLIELLTPATRDVVLLAVDRVSAADQIDAWSALVRMAPAGLVAPAASVLGFLAWLAGDGALAWCALERAWGDEVTCRLADVVEHLLDQAVPPDTWDPL